MAVNTKQSRIAMRDVLYNEYCCIQKAAMQAALGLIPTYSESKTLTIIDYGCSQGATSIAPIEQVISTLPNGAICRIFFEDTPYNDFSSLAKTIEDNISTLNSPNRSILVFPTMVPVGFFRQVIPSASADLGFSWSSFNYLEATPDVSLDAGAPPSVFMAARQAAFGAAGARDIVNLLHLRAREIRSGGYLIAAIGGQKPVQELRPSNTGFMPLQAAMLKMIAAGSLTSAEMMQMALFPSHERSIEDMRAALEDTKVAPLWHIEKLEPKLIEHPAWAKYQAALRVAGTDSEKAASAVLAYAHAVIANLVSSSGWFWVDTLKNFRGPEWLGGESFLKELTSLAIEECMDKFGDMKVELWYHYVKLRRTRQVINELI